MEIKQNQNLFLNKIAILNNSEPTEIASLIIMVHQEFVHIIFIRTFLRKLYPIFTNVLRYFLIFL